MDLQALILKFLAWQRSRKCADFTLRNQAEDLQHYQAFIIANPTLNPLTPEAIEEYRKSLDIAVSTWNRAATSICSMLRLAHGLGVITDPVYEAVARLKEPGHEPTTVPDDLLHETDKIATGSDKRTQAIYRLMAFDGLRLCEVHRANVQDFRDHPQTPSLTVHGKGMRERTVYLHPETSKAVRDLVKGLEPGPLFCTQYGRMSRRAIQYTITGINEELGCHKLRRTAVSAVVNNLPDMASLPLVANQFGHTVPILQKHYLKVDPMKVLAAKLGRS